MNKSLFVSNGAVKSAAPFLLAPSQAEVITLLRKHGSLSRTDIASVTGYSRSKITAVVQQLTDLGIVEEIGDGESSGGRRPRVLNFRRDFGYIIGIDMGATSVDLALADFNGNILDRSAHPIDVREGPEIILAHLRGFVLDQLQQRRDLLGHRHQEGVARSDVERPGCE